MGAMIDLGPAAKRMTALLGAVEDGQLTAPTPCPDYTLGDLIDHVGGLALAFEWAAAKEPPPQAARPGDASRLDGDWRDSIPARLDALAAAWDGTTTIAGMELPARLVAAIVLNELVIHGWDVARASGQYFDVDATELETCRQAMGDVADGMQRPDGGPFGQPVELPEGAPLLDQVIGLSGRDPGWTPDSR